MHTICMYRIVIMTLFAMDNIWSVYIYLFTYNLLIQDLIQVVTNYHISDNFPEHTLTAVQQHTWH